MSMPKILKDIRSLRNSIGKYNSPIVTRSTPQTTELVANPLPTSWTGSGSLFTNGGYQIESSFNPSNVNPLNFAFNGNTSDYCRGLVSGVGYIIITLPEAITVSAFKTYIPAVGLALDTIQVQGSNNRSNWNTLTNSNYETDSDLREKPINNTTAYKYYRFVFNMESAGDVQVNEIQLSKYIVTTYSNHLAINLQELVDMQRIMIKVPATYSDGTNITNTGVQSNYLNGKLIDLLLEPDKYYELIYVASSDRFIAKEVM